MNTHPRECFVVVLKIQHLIVCYIYADAQTYSNYNFIASFTANYYQSPNISPLVASNFSY